MLVSIIVPIYNTGDIIYKTIDSIITQTYKNIEIILVDDGSTDNSGKICDNYANIDKRIHVIHKKNGGICEARNIGLREASGDFITFCDHDDIYDRNIISREIDLIKTHNADIAIVGKRYINKKSEIVFSADYMIERIDLTDKFIQLYNSGLIGTIWNILYKRELVENTEFDTSLKRGHEDVQFNLKTLVNASKIVATKDVLYTHFIREELSTSAKVYPELIDVMIKHHNSIYDIMLMFGMNTRNQIKENIIAQGETTSSVLSYALKNHVSYDSFKIIANKLKYVSVDKIVFDVKRIKHIVIYILGYKRMYLLLYMIYKLKRIG